MRTIEQILAAHPQYIREISDVRDEIERQAAAEIQALRTEMADTAAAHEAERAKAAAETADTAAHLATVETALAQGKPEAALAALASAKESGRDRKVKALEAEEAAHLEQAAALRAEREALAEMGNDQ